MSRRYDDDYEGSNFEKFTRKKNKKSGKGHQSRFQRREEKWESILIEEAPIVHRSDPAPHYQKPSKQNVDIQPFVPENKTEYQFGPNTREVKGVKIDYDGVIAIDKVENVKDGVNTFGIKFSFKGNKGLYRIIWFNTNFRLRDSTYNTEYAFWLTVNSQKGEKR